MALAARRRGLLGREREIRKVLSYIESPEAHRVLVLWGPTGSGRTSILREVLARVGADVRRRYADLSPAAKPLGVEGVVEERGCYGDEIRCIEESVEKSFEEVESVSKLVLAFDGVGCLEERGGFCEVHRVVRSLARLVEAYPDKVRVILSIDEQDAVLDLGVVGEYIDVLIVEGLPRDAAIEFVRSEATEANINIPDDKIDDIVGATAGLPLHMLVVVHDYRGDLQSWLQDMSSRLRWKVAVISSRLGLTAREAAKRILDLIDRPLAAIPRQSFEVLKLALKTNIVYISWGEIIRVQLPVYRAELHRIAYGGL